MCVLSKVIMYAKSKAASEPFVREILLCDTVLKGESDSILEIPLPRAVTSDEQVYFEAIFLSLDTNVVLGSEITNSKASKLLNSFSDGLFVCQVMRYGHYRDTDYAIISIHSNQTISYQGDAKKSNGEAVFAFRYWIDRIPSKIESVRVGG